MNQRPLLLVLGICFVLSAFAAFAQNKWTLPHLKELPQANMLTREGAHLSAREMTFLKEVTAREIAVCVQDPGPGDPTTADGLFLSLRVKRVDLAQSGMNALIVQGNDVCMCGATGNCTFWLIADGPNLKVLLKATGIQTFAIQKSKKSGYFDIVLGSQDSAMETYLREFKFDGKEYRLRRCSTIEWDDWQGNALAKPRIMPYPCS